jgi:hypothetical protein
MRRGTWIAPARRKRPEIDYGSILLKNFQLTEPNMRLVLLQMEREGSIERLIVDGVEKWRLRQTPALPGHAISLVPAGALFIWRCHCGKQARYPLSRFRANRNADAHTRAAARSAL